jgi:hypothetical protein
VIYACPNLEEARSETAPDATVRQKTHAESPEAVCEVAKAGVDAILDSPLTEDALVEGEARPGFYASMDSGYCTTRSQEG